MRIKTIFFIILVLFLMQAVAFSAPPTITSFSPIEGPTGTIVTINGTDFTGIAKAAISVQFGGVDAASFTIRSSSLIDAEVGSGATGRIMVSAPGGTAYSAQNFTFLGSVIPTLNEWGMLFMAGLFVLGSIIMMRKN